MNRLARETSPYLQQHKDNPVDWYPWGEEAFGRARAEDRPILLSVGYSACHWCHVMEHESFANEATAALMNEWFVSIKVDREERPDVDGLYMQAVQQMTGHGGWPMTVFLTPDGAPFYGGTYFPPEPRHGLPSFRQILEGVHEAYRERRSEVDQGAAQLTAALAQGMAVNPDPVEIEASVLERAYRRLLTRFDDRLGGFGGAPKFPQPMILDFLLRYWVRTGTQEALGMVETTLDAMASGGMYDQVGGGFHRYSVDAEWLVPHFEKMLYDNALLSVTYLHAYQVTGRPDFRTVTEEVLDYVLREMRSPEGGFYSSQDADSEGVEGRFYVWSADEIDELLGADDGEKFRLIFGVTEEGNWEDTNVLHRPEALARLAEELGTEVPKLEELKARGRQLLYAQRSRRVWPARDEKVIAGWNAMMMTAFAEAGRVLSRADYVTAADACADFILGQMSPGGRVQRSWRDGTARIDGFLEDYALLVDGLLSVYAATFDPRRVEQARSVADRMLELFWDPEREIFFDTAKDGERLVVRPRDIYDNATPSGTSAAAQALIRLSRLTAESEYERVASRVLRGMAKVAAELPQGFGLMLSAIAHHLAPPTEVAIVGVPAQAETAALLDVVNRAFVPNTAVALLDPSAGDAAANVIPLLADRPMRNGRATAYVCRHYTCKEPVTEPRALALDLDTIVGGGEVPG